MPVASVGESTSMRMFVALPLVMLVTVMFAAVMSGANCGPVCTPGKFWVPNVQLAMFWARVGAVSRSVLARATRAEGTRRDIGTPHAGRRGGGGRRPETGPESEAQASRAPHPGQTP